jgi:tetratricopeptide (TPR) repeat protein
MRVSRKSTPQSNVLRQCLYCSLTPYSFKKSRSKCQNQIAQCRAGIIRLNRQRDDLNTNISNEVIKLNDRKARLSKLDQQIDTVHGLKRIISQQSGDVLRRYFSWWRAKTTSALDAKKTITSLAQYCRRQMLRKAWLKLQLQKRTVCSSFAHAGGIGQRLIETAEACIENDHNEASCLAHDLNLAATTNELPMNVGNHDFLDDLMSNEDLTAYLPCKDDIACLEKGAFYFRSARYSSSLKCLELVVSKMRSLRYFEGIHNVHATTIQSAVWGKLAQVHLMLEKYDTAIVYYNRQRCLANEINLQEPQFNAMIGLGRCYIAKSDVEYAHSLFQEALSGISQIGKAIDTRQLALVFTWLEKSLTQMNRLTEAAGFAAKLNEMRDRRKEQVQAAIDEMGVMQQRMIDINARKSRAVLLETASANLVLFKRERAKKQRLISQYTENLSKTTERIEKLLDLESQLKLEIQEASTTKKKRLVSRLINGMSQEIKTSELIHRLKDQLGVVEGKRNEAVAGSDRIGLLIHNTQDEIARIDDSIAIENGPLMQRVLKKRNYRCMALNASNSARNDVAGTSKGCIELVASTEGKELYLHNITTGKLEFAFTGDQEGRHIGEVYGHTSTISALRFHGDKVYTGGMDHCVIGWCVRSMKKLFVARGHEATVTCLWTNSSELVSGSADTTIILWKKDDGSLLRRIHGHARGVHHIISSSIPSSNLNMVSASYGTLFCWRRDASSTVRKKMNCINIIPTQRY